MRGFLHILAISIFCIAVPLISWEKPMTAAKHELDGVYQFVSETSELTQPGVEIKVRKNPDWAGIWQFQQGYYSSIITPLPRNDTAGGSAYTGTFEIDGDKLILNQEYAISSLEANRQHTVRFHFEGKRLILRQHLQSYIEDMREGYLTTVLEKIR